MSAIQLWHPYSLANGNVEHHARWELSSRSIAEPVKLPQPVNDVELVTPAVNAIASWAATTGLAEAARRVTISLCQAEVNVAIDDFDYGAPQSPDRVPPIIQKLPTGRPYGIDLVFLNVNELRAVPEHYLKRGGHYKIGSWYWELPDFSKAIRNQINRVDEIWVASHFVRDAFLQYTDMPIQVFPAIVEPKEDHSLMREDFGIDPERCMFFFNFDGNSTFARKNPWGVIDAYREAFGGAERRNAVQLVIKTINLHRHGEGRARLEEELASVDGLLIDQELTERQMASLVGCCDVYVSLHRAEGFGLGMAEAMYLGHPVIATAYSGNMEFTTLGNSCQIGYTMRPITHEELRFNESSIDVYNPGMLWAEPDVGQAARWMRLLFEDPNLRTRIGKAGQQFVRSELSAATIGARMRKRLEVLTQRSI